MNHGETHDQQRVHDQLGRPQPEYRINLTLAVTDPQAIWAAAAARLLDVPEMTLSDVLDVIGPREDPSISDCIATMAKPVAFAGCVLDDFWIDALRGCPPRIDMASAVLDYKLASTRIAPHRATKRRIAPPIALSLIPALQDDAPTL